MSRIPPTGHQRPFPTAQLALLALVRVAEPIALTSIYPYAWKLVLTFHFGDPDNASFYAGILIAAFALAESISGMFWGSLSDRYGRKPILLFGCCGTILSLLMLGFAKSFWFALAGRIIGGLLNGNVGVIQTMVGELVTVPEHEPRAYSVMPFVWSIGTIVGPAIGGCFAEPSENFPSIFSPDGVFARFPYLLPNLICTALLLAAVIAGYFKIAETHPDMQPWSTQADLDTTTAETPLMSAMGGAGNAPANIRDDTYGTFNPVDIRDEQHRIVREDGRPSSVASGPNTKVYTRKIIMLIVALGIFTYHSMTYDNLLPIFFQDKRAGGAATSAAQAMAGGLDLSTQQVGVILSFQGIIALFIQGVVFPLTAAWLGIWKLFVLVTVAHPLAYFVVPFLTLVPPGGRLYAAIYGSLVLRNLLSILAYPVLLILIKEASPGRQYLGKVNGLAASVGAACRTLGAPVAGILYTVGSHIHFTGLAWWASAVVALIGALQIPLMFRTKRKTAHVRSLVHFPSQQEIKCEYPEIVHIHVRPSNEYRRDEEEPLLH